MTDQTLTPDGIRQHIDGGFYHARGVAEPAGPLRTGLNPATGLPVGATLVATARHSEDQSKVLVYQVRGEAGWRYRFERPNALLELGALMVYDHVWPFETSTWARPLAQFTERFTPVTQGDLTLAMDGDRVSAQAAISTTRSERRRRSPTPQAVEAGPGKVEALLRTVDDRTL